MMAEEAKAQGEATCSLRDSEKEEQVWNPSLSEFQALNPFSLLLLCLPPTSQSESGPLGPPFVPNGGNSQISVTSDHT